LHPILKQDRHLYHWQAHYETKLVRRTRARVQQWCAMLTNKYAAIGFEDLSIKDLKEQDTPLGHVVARGIQAMAPGRVRQAAEQAANKRSRTFLKVDYRNTTRACATCGNLRDGDLAADLITCERCGTSSPPWVTAATNILHRASEELQATRAALLEGELLTGTKKRTLLRRNRKKKPGEVAPK
jgi:transposase